MDNTPSKTVSLWGIRPSIWGAGLVLLGAGMAFDQSLNGPNTSFGVVMGTLAGSTALAVFDHNHKQRKGSRVGIVMGVVAIVWIAA